MKSSFLSLFFCGIIFCSFAQNSVDTVYRFGNDSMMYKFSLSAEDKGTVFIKTEVAPKFPGGTKAWDKYVSDNLLNPNDYKGKVIVRFIVERDGSTNSYQVVLPRDLSNEDESKIISFLKNSGKWFPAKQNGYCVRSWYQITI